MQQPTPDEYATPSSARRAAQRAARREAERQWWQIRLRELRPGYVPRPSASIAYSQLKTLHQWINRTWGPPRSCENCGGAASDWASIDHVYTRKREDWIELCRRCHRQMDSHGHQIAASKRGVPGSKHSPETKARMSESHTGKAGIPLSAEHRAKTGAASRERWADPAFRAKVTAAMKAGHAKKRGGDA